MNECNEMHSSTVLLNVFQEQRIEKQILFLEL